MQNTVTDETRSAAAKLIYDNIHCLQSSKHGQIDVLPFSHDSEVVRLVKAQVADGLVELLENHGLIREIGETQQVSTSEITVKCNAAGCDSQFLVQMRADEDGVCAVDAEMFISRVAKLDPRCPHDLVGVDSLREHLQRELESAVAEGRFEADE
jgi:hypothetical protein